MVIFVLCLLVYVVFVVRFFFLVLVEECEKILEDVEYNVFVFFVGFFICDFLLDFGILVMIDV